MKHSINLYRADLVPKRPLLDLQRVLTVVLVLWVIGVGWRVVLEIQTMRLESQLQAAQTEQRQKQQLLSQLSAQVAQLQIDPQLERRVRQLQAEVQNKRSVLFEFTELGSVQSFDYAAIMTELARVHEEGLWVTRIEENRGVLNLHGHAVDPALIPRWMQKFQETEQLSHLMMRLHLRPEIQKFSCL
ncbi:PilN domain-containing protein [Aliidiomarina sanyensis]|uniref:Uncharacterized protein n=1 Tax=Aliidiomarina sanyensis TaxID=1249555 RepID=A0A432WI85_9GAMM|nr:PilN domain-containing protein [Aliidiomarina sanyensis]RUO33431.1 hypothetical protein CWE11_06190 [Aliidiomarina sanyensis]